jgi:hypothetical protein
MMNVFNKYKKIENLVIVESAIKAETLSVLLKKGGLPNFHVFSTEGFLYEKFTVLSPIGIDRSFNEIQRLPRNPKIISTLIKWADSANKVLIVFDVDQIGDALAIDVANLLDSHGSVLRVRLRSYDFDSVLDAFSHKDEIQVRDAYPAVARRLLDGLFSSYLANKFPGIDLELSATFVLAGILAAVKKSPIQTGIATIAVNSSDGGYPFVCHIPINAENEQEVLGIVQKSIIYADEGGEIQPGKLFPLSNLLPWTYGECLIEVSKVVDRDIIYVDQALDRLYAAGKLSYPKSLSRSLGGDALDCLMKISYDQGVKCSTGMIPSFSRSGRHSHESPRPLYATINIGSPLLLMHPDEAALVMIARRLISCGQPHSENFPDVDSLPSWAKGLRLSRIMNQRLQPWPKSHIESCVRMHSVSESILMMLMENKMANPSVWMENIKNIIDQDLIDESLCLTSKGNIFFSCIPLMLQDSRAVAHIDALISASSELTSDEVPAQICRHVLDQIGILDDVVLMLNSQKNPN